MGLAPVNIKVIAAATCFVSLVVSTTTRARKNPHAALAWSVLWGGGVWQEPARQPKSTPTPFISHKEGRDLWGLFRASFGAIVLGQKLTGPCISPTKVPL